MLAQLTAGALADAAARRETVSQNLLEKLIESSTNPRDAYRALEPTSHVRVIAEIKRASPSKGELATISNPAELAVMYAESCADAISVLTEERKFNGSLDDLRAVRDAVAVPILRKDFIAEEYQLLEARAFGADLALLIVAALDHNLLSRLYNFATDLGLAVLVETHTSDEVKRAMDIGARLVGVNARNLSTFELDTSLFGSVRHLFDTGVTAVAESAVATVEDVQRYRDHGADVVLIGETLVRAADPRLLLQQFREVH